MCSYCALPRIFVIPDESSAFFLHRSFPNEAKLRTKVVFSTILVQKLFGTLALCFWPMQVISVLGRSFSVRLHTLICCDQLHRLVNVNQTANQSRTCAFPCSRGSACLPTFALGAFVRAISSVRVPFAEACSVCTAIVNPSIQYKDTGS